MWLVIALSSFKIKTTKTFFLQCGFSSEGSLRVFSSRSGLQEGKIKVLRYLSKVEVLRYLSQIKALRYLSQVQSLGQEHPPLDDWPPAWRRSYGAHDGLMSSNLVSVRVESKWRVFLHPLSQYVCHLSLFKCWHLFSSTRLVATFPKQNSTNLLLIIEIICAQM